MFGLLPFGGTAAPAEETGAAQDNGWGSYIEGAQENLSREIVDTGRWLDGLFGTEPLQGEQKGSLLRLGVQNQLERGGASYSPEVRLQLALPRTEKRFNIYLESQTRDTFDNTEESSPGVAQSPNPDTTQTGTDYLAGVKYVRETANYLNFRADAGMVLHWPPNPYTRLRLRKSYFLGDWEVRFGETVFWSHKRGRGAETEMLWQHPMPQDFFFRSDTKTTYLEREGTFFSSHEFTITERLAPMEALVYRMAVSDRGDDGEPYSQVLYDLRWRRSLYKRWLLMEVRPAFVFPADQDFEMQPRLYFSVEALFGDPDEFGF